MSVTASDTGQLRNGERLFEFTIAGRTVQLTLPELRVLSYRHRTRLERMAAEEAELRAWNLDATAKAAEVVTQDALVREIDLQVRMAAVL